MFSFSSALWAALGGKEFSSAEISWRHFLFSLTVISYGVCILHFLGTLTLLRVQACHLCHIRMTIEGEIWLICAVVPKLYLRKQYYGDCKIKITIISSDILIENHVFVFIILTIIFTFNCWSVSEKEVEESLSKLLVLFALSCILHSIAKWNAMCVWGVCVCVCRDRGRERQTHSVRDRERERGRIIWFGDSLHYLWKPCVVQSLPFSLHSPSKQKHPIERESIKGKVSPQFIQSHGINCQRPGKVLADDCFSKRTRGQEAMYCGLLFVSPSALKHAGWCLPESFSDSLMIMGLTQLSWCRPTWNWLSPVVLAGDWECQWLCTCDYVRVTDNSHWSGH